MLAHNVIGAWVLSVVFAGLWVAAYMRVVCPALRTYSDADPDAPPTLYPAAPASLPRLLALYVALWIRYGAERLVEALDSGNVTSALANAADDVHPRPVATTVPASDRVTRRSPVGAPRMSTVRDVEPASHVASARHGCPTVAMPRKVRHVGAMSTLDVTTVPDSLAAAVAWCLQTQPD